MFHYITGKAQAQWDRHYLISNGGLGVSAYYAGNKKSGERYLYPIIDDNHKTVLYYAFDEPSQLELFTQMAKIAGVWPKLAFALTGVDQDALHTACVEMDIKFLQSIPGIWPKLAKRLIVELNATMSTDDLKKLTIDRSLYRDIVTTLTNLWYKSQLIDPYLQSCPYELIKTNLPEIMKYLIVQLSSRAAKS